MRIAKLNDMVRGWFVGDFEPTVLGTKDFEVGVKNYISGAKEDRHHHKIATEITLILSGRVLMNGNEFSSGDIVILEPNECTDFEALVDTVTVIIKVPGATNDKYLGDA